MRSFYRKGLFRSIFCQNCVMCNFPLFKPIPSKSTRWFSNRWWMQSSSQKPIFPWSFISARVSGKKVFMCSVQMRKIIMCEKKKLEKSSPRVDLTHSLTLLLPPKCRDHPYTMCLFISSPTLSDSTPQDKENLITSVQQTALLTTEKVKKSIHNKIK